MTEHLHGATSGDLRSRRLLQSYFERGVAIRPGMTVLDVGANIGLFSLEVLRRSGGDVDLIAFEPAPETLKALEQNLRRWQSGARVRIDRRALSDRRGDGTLFYRPRVSGTSSLHRTDGGDPDAFIEGLLDDPPSELRDVFPRRLSRLPRSLRRVLLRAGVRWAGRRVIETPCEMTTLSLALRDHGVERVDFLKIDVEGAELEVLRGIDEVDWPKLEHIAAEVHDVDGRLAAIRELLESAGFAVQVEQEWPFIGTHMHLLHASRAPGGA